MDATNLETIKPQRLKPGDTVAAISLSSGAAGEFPQVYEVVRRVLKERLGLTLTPTPHALKTDDWLYHNPEVRADDLHWALRNPEVKGIFSTIGGYESVRVLPFIDTSLIRQHPKVMLGYSDTTVTHLAFLGAGVTSFYGPSLMSGVAELDIGHTTPMMTLPLGCRVAMGPREKTLTLLEAAVS